MIFPKIKVVILFYLVGTHHAHRKHTKVARLISSVVHDDVRSLRMGSGVHDKLHISSADRLYLLLPLA